MKFFTSDQIKKWDAFTIENEPITSIDLMERAANAFAVRLCELVDSSKQIHIFCGPGNNGGDGFAIARILKQSGYEVLAYSCFGEKNPSPDCQTNIKKLQNILSVKSLNSPQDFPTIDDSSIVIDALFGIGMVRPLEGICSLLVDHLNHCNSTILSVDVASGLYSDYTSNKNSSIIKPNLTLTFQQPKLALLLPENEVFVGKFEVLEIGLSREFYKTEDSIYHITNRKEASEILKPRSKFSHKGSYGHALVWTGSYGKMGAALLASKAAMRTGTGLLTAHIPSCGYTIMQTSLPDAMVEVDGGEKEISDSKADLTKYNAIGVGPGIGQSILTEKAFANLLTSTSIPLVIDADALNILSRRQEMFRYVPANSILTPHPKEFERLAGKAANDYESIKLLQEFCKAKNVITVLKGAHTIVCLPSGELHFNNSGNPAMAKAGMGDVLTGIIVGLLAQGYSPKDAAILGVYLHGKTADLLVEKTGPYSLLASDVAENIGLAFLFIM